MVDGLQGIFLALSQFFPLFEGVFQVDVSVSVNICYFSPLCVSEEDLVSKQRSSIAYRAP